MTKPLNPDEIEKLIEAEYDYRDFILQVASNNNWVYDWSEYSAAIVNAKKGALGRVSTTLKELEDDRFLIKQSGSRIYSVTTKGIKYYKSKTFTDTEDESKTKIDDTIDYNSDTEEANISDYDYNTIKLNRTSDSIDKVETKIESVEVRVYKATLVMAFASCVSVLVLIFQFLFSIYGTTDIRGEISILKEENNLEQLKKDMKQSIQKADHLTFELDSLKTELQKLTKK